MSCTADARPEPSFKILHHDKWVRNGTMYTIEKVNKSHVGNYTCVAENDLGSTPSDPAHLRLEGKISYNSTQNYFSD